MTIAPALLRVGGVIASGDLGGATSGSNNIAVFLDAS